MTASVTNPAIELDGIVKTYGRTTALDGLSLSVGRGELVGLLGPNGAGKTTTIKLLLGLARPTRGTGTVLGAPLGDRATRGGSATSPSCSDTSPGFGRERSCACTPSSPTCRRRAARRPSTRRSPGSGWPTEPTTRVSGFSKGMQQRLGLGVALLGDPELILLDEPTSALDPVGRTDVRAIVRAARDRGATVILNSHLLSEVEQVCDRVVILHRGRTIASGRSRTSSRPAGSASASPTSIEAGAAALSAFGPMEVDGPWLAIRPLDRSRIPEVVAAIVAAGGRVHAVEPGRGSLEARFLELVTEPAPTGDGRDRHRSPDGPRARSPARDLGLDGALDPVRAPRRVGARAARDLAREDAVDELQIQIGVSQILILIAFMFSFVLAMTAAFVGAPAIGGDLESGVAQAVLARPIRRPEVLVGRWLGCAAVVVAYTVAVRAAGDRRGDPRLGLHPARAAPRARVPVWPGARPPDPHPGARLRAAIDRSRRDRRRRVRARLDGRRHGRDRQRARDRAARPGRGGEPLAAAERRVVARGDLRARAAAGRC